MRNSIISCRTDRIGILFITLMKIYNMGVCAKTIRKWHLNLMIKEGVTESLADLIQGRAPENVGSAHYLNKVSRLRMIIEGLWGNFVYEFEDSLARDY